MNSRYFVLLLLAAAAKVTSAQRSGAHRNVLHWTPLKYMGPPTATLATDDHEFHVYYRAPIGKSSKAPYQWKEVHTTDFIRWEDGDVFAVSSSNPQASYESGVVYPNPVKPIPQKDTKYNVLLSRQSSSDVRLINRGSNDGTISSLMSDKIKPAWNVIGGTAVDAFPLQSAHYVAYLYQGRCDKVYFSLDDGRQTGQILSTLALPMIDATGTCTDLSIKKLDSQRWIIAMTRIPMSGATARTQYWVGSLAYNAGMINFLIDPTFHLGTDYYLDDGTDAAYFRLGRTAGRVKSVGYISGGPKQAYPDGLYSSLSLVRELAWSNGLQQSFPDMTKMASYSKPHLDKTVKLTTSACSGHIALTGKDKKGKVIPAIDAGWVFNFQLEEGDTSSGWEIQFRTGGPKDNSAEYVTLSYTGGTTLRLDRSRIHKTLGPKDSASKVLSGKRMGPVQVVLDKATLEVYVNSANAPTTVMTMAYWTEKPITDVCLTAKGTPGSLLASTSLYQIPSIWGSTPDHTGAAAPELSVGAVIPLLSMVLIALAA